MNDEMLLTPLTTVSCYSLHYIQEITDLLHILFPTATLSHCSPQCILLTTIKVETTSIFLSIH